MVISESLDWTQYEIQIVLLQLLSSAEFAEPELSNLQKLADKLKFENLQRVEPAAQWLIENGYIEAVGDGFRISAAGTKYVRQQLLAK